MPDIGEIQLSRKLGRGLIIDHAPPRARMALALLNMPSCGAGVVNAGQINIADQVLYQVTGYDPESACLLLELVEDWRPAPTATLTEADVEKLKARWLATYGNNQGAHPVEEVRAVDDEQACGCWNGVRCVKHCTCRQCTALRRAAASSEEKSGA